MRLTPCSILIIVQVFLFCFCAFERRLFVMVCHRPKRFCHARFAVRSYRGRFGEAFWRIQGVRPVRAGPIVCSSRGRVCSGRLSFCCFLSACGLLFVCLLACLLDLLDLLVICLVDACAYLFCFTRVCLFCCCFCFLLCLLNISACRVSSDYVVAMTFCDDNSSNITSNTATTASTKTTPELSATTTISTTITTTTTTVTTTTTTTLAIFFRQRPTENPGTQEP